MPLRRHRDGARGDLSSPAGAVTPLVTLAEGVTGRHATHRLGRPGTAAWSSSRHSAAATVWRTAATASGFTEIEVMP